MQGGDTDIRAVEITENVEQEEKRQQPKAGLPHSISLDVRIDHAVDQSACDECTGVVLKIIPHVDGKPRILDLVRFDYKDLVLKGAWTGPGALELFHHALAPLAELPVHEIVSVTHTICDITLRYGKVVCDYLA